MSVPVRNRVRVVSAALSNSPTLVKGSPGQLTLVVVANAAAAARYVKFYDKATAPTVGTDVPAFTLLVPTASTMTIDLSETGVRFDNGIGFAFTTDAPDAGVAQPGADEVFITVGYQ